MPWSAQWGWAWNQWQKDRANALFIAGGYSFRGDVFQDPSFPLPMALRFGRSLEIWCSLSCVLKEGKFNASKRVGFGDHAPRSPCARSICSTLGKRSSNRVIANLQIEGLVSSSGSCGCSRTPKPWAHAREKRSSMEKSKSSLPVATCNASRMLSELNPHSSKMSLKGRGPCRGRGCWSVAASTKRACDHVSQGGPQSAPQTHPALTPSNQKVWVVSCLTLPHCWSMIKSNDTTQRVVPSAQSWS